MAKKRRRVLKIARRRRFAKARSAVSRSRIFGGKHKDLIDGALAGVAVAIIPDNIPYGDDIAVLGVGIFRNNQTLKVLGAMGIIGKLANNAMSGNLLGGTSGGPTYL
jgi:hypothetical protein